MGGVIRRLPGWQGRLEAWLADCRGRPFACGRHDCALFAAGAVLAMTGVDLADGWRGRYRTALGARRILKKAGHDSPLDIVAAALPEIPPVAALPGDVAAIAPESDGDWPALGIVQGAQVHVLRPDGLGLVGRSRILRAWRVD